MVGEDMNLPPVAEFAISTSNDLDIIKGVSHPVFAAEIRLVSPFGSEGSGEGFEFTEDLAPAFDRAPLSSP